MYLTSNGFSGSRLLVYLLMACFPWSLQPKGILQCEREHFRFASILSHEVSVLCLASLLITLLLLEGHQCIIDSSKSLLLRGQLFSRELAGVANKKLLLGFL